MGLYMHIRPGEKIHATAGVQYGGYKRVDGPSGAEVVLDGVRFTLDLIGDQRTHREDDVGSLKLYRPSGIWFDHADAATFHIGFEWGDLVASAQSVVVHVE